MFGKLRVKSCQLDEAASELYRGHFCGSCHALREQSGRLSTLLTNYDQTVLSLVLGGLEGAAVETRPCTAMPLRGVPVAQLTTASRTYLAAVNLLLVEAKLRDDVADEGRWRSRMGAAVVGGRARRAERQMHQLGLEPSLLLQLPVTQAAAERAAPRRGVRGFDDLAAPTAAAMAWVFGQAACVAGAPEHEPSLARFGGALGAFVYVLDAWEDRAEDQERGRFNAVDASHPGVRAASGVTAVLSRCLEIMEQELESGWAGDRTGILRGLLRTMRGRALEVSPSRAEAGDCDVCGCCCADGACAEASCCEGCSCMSIDCGCVECCLCSRTGRRQNPEKKKNRRDSSAT